MIRRPMFTFMAVLVLDQDQKGNFGVINYGIETDWETRVLYT